MRCSRVGPAATLAVAVAAVGLSGCGGGPPMGEVSGKVTFEHLQPGQHRFRLRNG